MIATDSVLLTDLYQLTMLQTYHAERMHETAVFELFTRRLPLERNFLIAAGLEQVLDYLENLHFTAEELDWLADCGRFGPDFIAALATFRFTGTVHALPEGTAFFANEPVLRVTAPLSQAQLVESRLINLIHFQTVIASKAARCVLAAPDKLLVDFGMRRAHGAEAALLAARAAYLTGFAGSATVLAGIKFGIPLFGTMAHSLIQAHDREEDAFERFAIAQPGNVVLLIDTYDTEAAAHKLVKLAPRLREYGITIKGVRIDSGDLAEHARRVRRILDAGGLAEVTLFGSSDLDEYRLRELLADGAPFDGFGIGTRLDASTDAPTLDLVYKLQDYAGRPRRKRSEGKATWPGRKQVYRQTAADSAFIGDCLGLEDQPRPGDSLLIKVMEHGRRLQPPEPLAVIRNRTRAQLAALPVALRAHQPAPPYPVTIAPELYELAARLDREAH
ncbi:MAG: nicotinate phosphoribosyltransferase [Candidatus Competibacteraceae bacterium]|uniref:Nicotinate phosphoribosyltransferase n=1 Tax=Candidatus Contendobacter odensis Run_B_J11 TaxID=1400861 RepID=A0A7U7GDF8_9GAMM|nr:nicotinate phosphoribosyltransferase [Candidatus Contendobacter odensis]MBK8537674.1 nicotinate phosphoribosyltransferase [Candidatus Competibacteraceae bacterium]MBK8750642.1 nicotinate phosphoribosyltransferase [Candidatus Competibacteraceae bacterium]CDH46376.1 Nicotinate phosphoribosyltransferase [Candidatus Contendobacter odensis Run_B_J11]